MRKLVTDITCSISFTVTDD